MISRQQVIRASLGALLLGAVCAAAYLGLHKGRVSPTRDGAGEGRATNRVAAAKGPRTNAVAKSGGHLPTGQLSRVTLNGTNRLAGITVEKTERTPEQIKATEMRELLDGGKEKEALQAARGLMGSSDVGVRSRVLSVLGWLGSRALPELTQMLTDENEALANEALTQWKMALDEVDDVASKADLLVTAINSMKNSTDMEALVLSFSQLPNDVAVRSLVQIIQGGNTAAAAVGREHYSFVTQTDYTSPEAAEAWIRQNVEQPEPVAVKP